MNSQPALRRILTLSALALALAPASALAQSSDDGYETDGPTVQNQIEGGGTAGQNESGNPTPSNDSADSGEEAGLPFTGLDLGLLAGAGVLLVGMGAGVRFALRLPPPAR